MCNSRMAVLASASAALAGFQYQREVAICENSGETLRDYQVLVVVSDLQTVMK